ncbi:MAG TPA: hypothetical protein VFN23_19235 [Ktedonobacteraceae bacterium]|nr:hypothetical protein [Ktedonobacteraceae bacterium]
MQDTLLINWGNFYVIVGTAAASLTGLMFVVITLITGNQARRSTTGTLGAFGTPTVVHFGSALFFAATLSAPWHERWNVALLVGLAGLGGVIYMIVVTLRALRQNDYEPVLEDWVWHTILPFVSYVTFAVAGIVLLFAPIPMLFFVGGAMVLLLFIGIHNSWDTVTYVTTQPPENEPQD